MITLNDIPNADGEGFSERITVPITKTTLKKLKFLKEHKNKKVADVVRTLLDDFLKDIEVEAS